MRSGEIKEKFKNAVQSPAQTVVLAGAGISLSQPSNLPLAVDIMKAVIRGLSASPRVEDCLMKALRPKTEETVLTNNYLRMEYLLEMIYGSHSPAAIRLLEKADAPNLLHFCLAKMANAGAVIMTTNFDMLLEKACALLGYKYQVLISPEDFESYTQNKNADADGICYILKLHGCAGNLASIQTTLQSIGKELNMWTDQFPKSACFNKLVKDRDLIIMGYSASDDFDIVPALQSIASEKSLFWLDHESGTGIEKMASTSYPSPGDPLFAGNKKAKAVFEELTNGLQGELRNGDNLYLLKADTGRVLGDLLPAVFPYKETSSLTLQEFFDQLETDIQNACPDEVSKCFLSSLLLNKLGERELEFQCLRRGADICQETGEHDFKGTLLFHLGKYYQIGGDIQAARQIFLEVMQIASTTKNELLLSKIVSTIGGILFDLGETEKALKLFNQAITIDKGLGDAYLLATDYLDIAGYWAQLEDRETATRYYEEAARLYLQSGSISGYLGARNNLLIKSLGFLDNQYLLNAYSEIASLARAYGDIQALVETLGNRGIIHSHMGKFTKAYEYMEEAISIAEKYSYSAGEARWVSEMGYLYVQQGKQSQALPLLKRASASWIKAGDLLELGTVNGRLGLLYLEQNNLNQAEVHFKAAIEYDTKANWKKGLADDYGNMGNLCKERNNFNEAHVWYLKALDAAKEIGYKDAVARQLGNVGVVLTSLGKLEEALAYDLEALKINREMSNKIGEAYTLLNIGGDYLSLGNMQKAKEFIEMAKELAEIIGLEDIVNRSKQVLSAYFKGR